MKSGVGIFLAVFVAIGLSWGGFVLAPQWQLGRAKLEPVLNSAATYPLPPTGAAALGLQVYRANGCAACHTEQVRQTGVAYEVVLTSLGGQPPEDFIPFVQSLLPVVKELAPFTNAINASLQNWKGDLPKVLFACQDKTVGDGMVNRFKSLGIKAEMRVAATGPDIARGWGNRRSVAADFLYAQPVQLGSLRVGPDLADYGSRAPGMALVLQRLYAPRSVMPDSTMPAFRSLFAVQKIQGRPSLDALKLPPKFAPAANYEIVPTPEALQLAAYLLSLQANAPLYEAPFSPP